jgi:hypothetical protein
MASSALSTGYERLRRLPWRSSRLRGDPLLAQATGGLRPSVERVQRSASSARNEASRAVIHRPQGVIGHVDVGTCRQQKPALTPRSPRGSDSDLRHRSTPASRRTSTSWYGRLTIVNNVSERTLRLQRSAETTTGSSGATEVAGRRRSSTPSPAPASTTASTRSRTSAMCWSGSARTQPVGSGSYCPTAGRLCARAT